MNFEQTITQLFSNPYFAVPFSLWLLIWKGLALWKASQKRQLPWFIILLLLNTMGLFEIVYFFYLNKFDLDQGRLLKAFQEKFGKKK